jgi:hypothetical protein
MQQTLTPRFRRIELRLSDVEGFGELNVAPLQSLCELMSDARRAVMQPKQYYRHGK